jgi:hypothetical protein
VAVEWCDTDGVEGIEWKCVAQAGQCHRTESGNNGDIGGKTYAEHWQAQCSIDCEEPLLLDGLPVVCELTPELGAGNELWAVCRCGEPLFESVTAQ